MAEKAGEANFINLRMDALINLNAWMADRFTFDHVYPIGCSRQDVINQPGLKITLILYLLCKMQAHKLRAWAGDNLAPLCPF